MEGFHCILLEQFRPEFSFCCGADRCALRAARSQFWSFSTHTTRLGTSPFRSRFRSFSMTNEYFLSVVKARLHKTALKIILYTTYKYKMEYLLLGLLHFVSHRSRGAWEKAAGCKTEHAWSAGELGTSNSMTLKMTGGRQTSRSKDDTLISGQQCVDYSLRVSWNLNRTGRKNSARYERERWVGPNWVARVEKPHNCDGLFTEWSY